ncbi:sensor histidine kinase [Paramicrobacterium agarici]|uniref:sensor histidine kinase n=1 Tax=Paramicrobacterium agarici TaxID=630514 RepID=UPI0011522200|nr:HAMP domain-containing sensor histidine kinase [Microbacterium agarici]TQO22128.1 two-component system OmpR family sensor kinase [Microbacterium agarici]
MGRHKQRPLRRSLVLATVALISLSALVIGLVSVFSLQSILLNRIDRQLVEAASRSAAAVGPSAPESDSSPDFIGSQGQSIGTLGAVRIDGSVVIGAYLDQKLDSPLLSSTQLEQLQSEDVGQRPESVYLGSSLGNYRVVAVPLNHRIDIIVGLPLYEIEATISELVLVVAIVALGALVLSGVGAYGLVRLTLRPLERVTAAATTVSTMTLDRGDVALAVRVPDDDTDTQTEVGRVGLAINRMLEHVSNALQARQRSEDKVRRFVSDASHELRTPLASIRGYAELTRMSGEAIPDDAAYAIGRIESESRRMTDIVEDLLLLARLDEGRQLDDAPVDVTELVHDAVSDARAAAGDHEWLVDAPEHPVMVSGDHGRLFQVVMNLLSNARVHTPAGTVVETALAVHEHDGTSVAEITISDDGPGIDPDMVDTVFERFVRGDSSRARSTGSTGLGLAIVQGVVTAHGGESSVTSEPGHTVFRITLPLMPSSAV